MSVKKTSRSLSKYEMTNLSLVNVMLYSIAIFFILTLVTHALIMLSRSELLHSYTDNNFYQAEQVAFQIQKSLALSQTEIDEPCSDADLIHLRKLKDIYYFIGDLGRISDKNIACTVENGILQRPITLPVVHTTVNNGIQYRNNQIDLIYSDDKRPIITYKDAMLLLSPAYLKLTKLGTFSISGMAGITYFKGDNRYVFSYFGHVLPEEIPTVIGHKNSITDWFPMPDKIRIETKCNNTYQLCVTGVDRYLGLYSVPEKGITIIFVLLLLLSSIAGVIIEYFRVGPRAFVRKLKKQIHQNAIFPVYQPQVNIHSQKVTGVESLARWSDSALGMISPEVFISVAEDYHLIETLTQKLMVKIFYELHTLLEANPLFTVSINISAELLTSDNFVNFLNQLTSQYRFNRNQVILEVTERTVSNKGKMELFSKKLKEQGYLVSIDDFGTGISNLSWLSMLEPNEIKVDKLFTQAIDTQTANSITLGGIFSMLEHLEVNVVFEGIETKRQRDYIHKRIPDATGQGWFFAKPQKIEDLKIFLEADLD